MLKLELLLVVSTFFITFASSNDKIKKQLIMEEITNVTREQVTKLIAKFIKEQYKLMGDKSNMELGIEHHNWACGFGRNQRWSHSEIYFNRKKYLFKDREITEDQFIHMLNTALEMSKVSGKVFYDVYGDGCWIERQTIFRRIEIFGKPCREFNELNKVLKKHTGKEVGSFDVFSVAVCGKRSSYSSSGRHFYLCHRPTLCQTIIDYIKANKGRNGIIRFSVSDYLNHGDEYDYEIAQYQESEWYGKGGNRLTIEIKEGKGKKNYSNDFVI